MLVSDTGHGFVRYVRLRFKAGILNILPLAPSILLVVVFGKDYPIKYIFSPERVFD
jgi:hypothetical protein